MKELMIIAVTTAILYVINFFWTTYLLVILQGFLAMGLFVAFAEKIGSLEDELELRKTIIEKQSERIRIIEANQKPKY